jgi:hypothetical protein
MLYADCNVKPCELIINENNIYIYNHLHSNEQLKTNVAIGFPSKDLYVN